MLIYFFKVINIKISIFLSKIYKGKSKSCIVIAGFSQILFTNSVSLLILSINFSSFNLLASGFYKNAIQKLLSKYYKAKFSEEKKSDYI